MSMSRKDFVAVAESVRLTREHNDTPDVQVALDRLVDYLCVDFRAANAHFDSTKFRAACALDRKDTP